MTTIQSQLRAQLAEHESSLRAKYSALEQSIAAANESIASLPVANATSNLSATSEAELTSLLVEAKGLITKRVEGEQLLERYREDMGYIVPPPMESKVLAGMSVAAGFVVEALANTVYFVTTSDSFATPAAAMSLAATLSGVNIVGGILTGTIAGRFLNFGRTANEDVYRRTRAAAWMKLLGCGALYSVFLYQSAGVRQLGAMEPIAFTLDNLVSLAIDPNTLGLSVVMFAGFYLGYRKAVSWDGEDPTYAILGRAVDNAQADLEDWAHDTLASLTGSVDDEIEQLREAENSGSDNSAISKLIAKCHKHKQSLDKAITSAEAAMNKKLDKLLRARIKGKPSATETAALQALCQFDEYLTLKVPTHPAPPDYSAQIEDLNQQKGKLIRQFRLALEKLIKQVESDYE